MQDKPDRRRIASHNARAWDTLAERNAALTRPATDADFADPLAAVDPRGWLGGPVAGKRVLCLAAGGGRQGPLFAAAGAEATVVDISPAMLARDRAVADARGLRLQVVEASMEDLEPLADGAFDLVVQPVSTCYVADVGAVYREVARVLVAGGLYVSQHKSPTSLQTSVKPGAAGRYTLDEAYYREGPLPPGPPSRTREPGTLEFLHRWEELVGGLCLAGFVVEDLAEPPHADPSAPAGDFGHRSRFAAPYVRIKARRVASASPPSGPTLWQPGSRPLTP